jgi:hypothetical protein
MFFPQHDAPAPTYGSCRRPNEVVKSAMRRRRIELLMEYFRDSQTECRRVQRLQPPPPLPAFYPPAPSLIDGLIGMFEMRQSLLSDSFKLSLSPVIQSVGLAPIFSSTDTIPTYALYRGLHTPAILQKRLGLDADQALCQERDTNSIGGIVLAVEMRSDAGEEYDYEAIKDLPPALAPAAAIEISESDEDSDDSDD